MTNYIKPIVFCEGCLSTDRKLTDVGEFYDIYVNLFIEASSKLSKNPLFCWECNAVLRTIHKFRERVQQANSYLNEGLNKFKRVKICLSTLSTSNISNNIIYAVHSEENDNNFKEEDIAADDNFDNVSTVDEPLIVPIEFKTEKSDNSDFENDFSIETDYINIENIDKDKKLHLEKQDTDNIDDDKKLLLEEQDIDKKKRKRPKSYINVRYTVKEYSKEEMIEMRKKCERVFMDDSEMALWREKAKLAHNYRTMAYKCETCISGFAKKQYYDKHVRRFHSKGSGDYECSICKQRILSVRKLSHMDMHTTKYICCVCGVECHPSYNLDCHLNSTHKRVVQCKKCNLQFNNRTECSRHYIKTHLRFICDYCNHGFTMKKRLIHHIGLRHTEHRCKICDKLYYSQHTLKRHNFAVHVKSISEETYCVECNLHFNNEILLKHHLTTSTKHVQKRFPCTECDKVYHKRTTLNNHYNLVHLQKTKNYCELCDRYFLTGYRLRDHKATTHDRLPKPKTKMCSICGRAFQTNRLLQNHMRTHTGERPFHCEFCTASFTQKYALVSHTRAIHKVH
ncbi:zinc finger protein 615-like isoform X1 [Colias croceus]|uniref:zinc finger protein 615-like isoform X1 n=1 Tax=Colias crocea TaxID=72248 RepID=UPI001E27EB3D|nr:zinc finger protein 615-like isoform X1 [Colias croceus]